MATLDQIAAYRPTNIDQALDAMRSALDCFHRSNDRRAVFLRAYYLITIAVHEAVHQRGRHHGRVFLDPAWIERLAGKFASLYFYSLTTEERPGERAWKQAHRLATSGRTSVLQDVLLGLNAHINYDLAYGIYLNMVEHDDGRDHLVLSRRKFDHDQVNEILVACIPQVKQSLTRDYGGEIRAVGDLAGRVGERAAGLGLAHYRERVWWSAISFLAAADEAERAMVHERLDEQSSAVAEAVALEGTAVRRAARRLLALPRRRTFGMIELERELVGAAGGEHGDVLGVDVAVGVAGAQQLGDGAGDAVAGLVVLADERERVAPLGAAQGLGQAARALVEPALALVGQQGHPPAGAPVVAQGVFAEAAAVAGLAGLAGLADELDLEHAVLVEQPLEQVEALERVLGQAGADELGARLGLALEDSAA
jgi:hypothetical protein